jgi:hypothetical protein
MTYRDMDGMDYVFMSAYDGTMPSSSSSGKWR